jgi:glyoxylase-like metal-dependent hydrolase (beta-lactamase superfamily II)
LGWEVIHTPGQTPGHISLFRREDRALIAGDAFSTVNQDSAFALLSQRQVLQYPPPYFTPDWNAAADSIQRSADLNPVMLAAGHGLPIRDDSGMALRDLLRTSKFRRTGVTSGIPRCSSQTEPWPPCLLRYLTRFPQSLPAWSSA